MMQQTASQTVGPFFGYGLPYDGGPDLVPGWRPGAISLHGRVLDGNGEPVPDALVEIWQAAADGTVPAAHGSLRRTRSFTGFGRCGTDAAGRYGFTTVRPGARDGAPHIAVLVFARGLLKAVRTRVYFPGEEAANAADPVLSAVDPARRDTLVALADGPDGYRFDVYLQGDRETVFFAF